MSAMRVLAYAIPIAWLFGAAVGHAVDLRSGLYAGHAAFLFALYLDALAQS